MNEEYAADCTAWWLVQGRRPGLGQKVRRGEQTLYGRPAGAFGSVWMDVTLTGKIQERGWHPQIQASPVRLYGFSVEVQRGWQRHAARALSTALSSRGFTYPLHTILYRSVYNRTE